MLKMETYLYYNRNNPENSGLKHFRGGTGEKAGKKFGHSGLFAVRVQWAFGGMRHECGINEPCGPIIFLRYVGLQRRSNANEWQ